MRFVGAGGALRFRLLLAKGGQLADVENAAFVIQSSVKRLPSIQLLRSGKVGGAEISAEATVRCSRHGPSLGYVVCVHVLRGAAPFLVRHPRPDDAGEILCADCIDLRAVDLAKLDVVCALCAADNLWIPSA